MGNATEYRVGKGLTYSKVMVTVYQVGKKRKRAGEVSFYLLDHLSGLYGGSVAEVVRRRCRRAMPSNEEQQHLPRRTTAVRPEGNEVEPIVESNNARVASSSSSSAPIGPAVVSATDETGSSSCTPRGTMESSLSPSSTVNTLMQILFDDEAAQRKSPEDGDHSVEINGNSSSHLHSTRHHRNSIIQSRNLDEISAMTLVSRNESTGMHSATSLHSSESVVNAIIPSLASTTTTTTATILTRTNRTTSTLLSPVRHLPHRTTPLSSSGTLVTATTAFADRYSSSNANTVGPPLPQPPFMETETRVWRPPPPMASGGHAESIPLGSTNLETILNSSFRLENGTMEDRPTLAMLPPSSLQSPTTRPSRHSTTATVLVSAYLVSPENDTEEDNVGSNANEGTIVDPTTTTPTTSDTFVTPLVVLPPRSKSSSSAATTRTTTRWWQSRRWILLVAAIVILVLAVVTTSLFLGDSRPSTGPLTASPPPLPLPLVIATTLELYEAVDAYLQSSSNGNGASPMWAPIGTWNVSRITNFSRVFDPDRTRDLLRSSTNNVEDGGSSSSIVGAVSTFDEDISAWDVSSGTIFYGMFAYASNFNGDVSNWNMSLATDTSYMFHGAARFNRDVSQWKVGRVTTMENMFHGTARFESDLSAWDVSNVQSMRGMFDGALLLDSDVSGWNVSTVQDLSDTFRRARAFRGDLSAWDVSRVTLMDGTFQFATMFAGDLSSWNVSRVTTMREMFADAVSFASDVSGWDVRSVQDTALMFQGASSFSVDLCDWRARLPSNVASDGMFQGSACPDPSEVFIPIGPLCHTCSPPTETSPFTTAKELYHAVDLYLAEPENANSLVALTYGHPIGTWDVSKLSDFSRVFDPDRRLEFSLDRVTSSESTFNEDLSDWDMSAATTLTGMFAYASAFNGNISTWNTSSVFNMDYLFAGAGQFNGDISLWDVAKVTSASYSFYNAAQFNSNVSAWDVGNVQHMNSMFQGAAAFDGDVSTWNVSNVVNTRGMFSGATVFNSDLSSWDVANVVDMGAMFLLATAFASDVSQWNVALVTDMRDLFWNAISFSSDLSEWDVGNVVDTSFMFSYLSAYDRDLSKWNVSNVKFMEEMFASASLFSSNLSQWDVGNVLTMNRMFVSAATFDNDLSAWDVSRVTTMSEMFSWAGIFNQDLSSWPVYNVTDISGMFRGAGRFNHDLCEWGSRLPAGASLGDAFRQSGCPTFVDPILPVGPFCVSCS
jgi:surface protein